MYPIIFRILSGVLMVSLFLSGCAAPTASPTVPAVAESTATQAPEPTSPPADTPAPPAVEADAPYRDAALPVEQRVADLLSRMTLEEKIGQMTQVEKGSIQIKDITDLYIGSILSGGGGSPPTNTPEEWAKMVDLYQSMALKTRLGIPLIYGVDAVHGHGNLKGATIFPHNIGLGAANDPDLMERIGRATAAEMAATGIPWNFAPVLAVVQDIRWGRTYESYGQDPALVSELGSAYVRGLQGGEGNLADPLSVLATPKHFIGDGATKWGTSKSGDYRIDQGDMQVDEATLRRLFLPPYQAAIDAGAMSIMVSFSSWNGVKMHAQKYLLTDVLKGELGFQGFLVSDWQAIDQIPGDYYSDVVTSINAGLDMIMVPYDYKKFISSLKQAVEKGDVSLERIDDAVRRILRVKFMLGVFERPYSDPQYLSLAGAAEYRELAREAVRKSLVLLRNEGSLLPLPKDLPLLLVAGTAADDIGVQCGGWTITWQGKAGKITPGTTIVSGIQSLVSGQTQVLFDRRGDFKELQGKAEVGIVVVAEDPYSEGVGDASDLSLKPADLDMIKRVRAKVDKLVVILISGRPLIVTPHLAEWDALVAAWLPGSEGAGVADVLFGDYPFTGSLSVVWPRNMAQLPLTPESAASLSGCDAPLFPYGYGLPASEPVELLDCP